MKVFSIATIILSFVVLYGMEEADKNWTSIDLPHNYMYPCENPPCGTQKTNVYATKFPTSEQKWYATYKEEGCPNLYRTTSTRWISDKHAGINGISFKGFVERNYTTKSMANQFAPYFHEEKCYNGGDEYGWVFPENIPAGKPQALFYLCGNCNILPEELKKKNLPPEEIEKQKEKWCNWPDPTHTGSCKTIGGNCAAVEEALKHPETYRYWNIKVIKGGNFLIELVDLDSYKTLSCIIERPSWLKNLSSADGFITINAQKKVTVERPQDADWHMYIDEVKVWK
jgi:hypothetical protein